MSAIPAPAPDAARGRDLADLLRLTAPHQRALEELLREQVTAFEPEVRELAAYCLESPGKRLRPLLVFLSGWRDGGQVDPDLVRAAAVVEMVHLATLVHDDIMDGAALRRGRETVAVKDGPSVAVLLGDALFAQAVVLSTRYPTPWVCRRVAEATRQVCSGEILQTLGGVGADPSRARYQRIIDLKTAELFAASCEIGATLAGGSDDFAGAAARFGRHLGIGYQIYDDLTDFAGTTDASGKTLGTDLASGKWTLPLQELLERTAASARPALLELIRSGRAEAMPLATAMREQGVFGAVVAAMHQEIERARAALAPWAGTPAVDLLGELCDALAGQARRLPGLGG